MFLSIGKDAFFLVEGVLSDSGDVVSRTVYIHEGAHKFRAVQPSSPPILT